MEVFTILKRGRSTDFSFSNDKFQEFTQEELNYAYKSRDAARDGSPALGDYRAMGRTIFSKRVIVKALEERNIRNIRSISRHFFAVSGVYARACKYMAYLPTYDYMITPYIHNQQADKRVIMSGFQNTLHILEDMNLKTRLADIALSIIVEGVYYGYVKQASETKYVLQDLPIEYCRSLYKVNGAPVVEFNLMYLDREFTNDILRNQVLDTLPREVKVAYIALKQGQMGPSNMKGEHWVKLGEDAVKFTMNKDDSPMFSSAIPEIIDLDDLRGIQKKKAESQLLKILIQKIPLDKNGDFIFDMEEAKAMHANAVRMLARAVNVDVLTTFADSDLMDLEEKRGAATIEVENWERATFTELGISSQLFATNGNLALEKSVANDESLMMHLVKQYQDWLNLFLKQKMGCVEVSYNIFFPRLTQHNRVDMAKLYKEQASLGYSKTLPAIALGQTQANMLANLMFEKDYLGLTEYMEPVKMSSTQSGKGSGEGAGRPEKPQDQKSDKTLANEAAGG